MGYYLSQSSRSPLPLVLCFMLLLSFSFQVAVAGRDVSAAASGKKETGGQVPAASDKKQTECIDQEGTVLIPGIGRATIGRVELPEIGGLDNSGPAAANGQYLPGNDDTFVPNPGFEVPNPARGVVVP